MLQRRLHNLIPALLRSGCCIGSPAGMTNVGLFGNRQLEYSTPAPPFFGSRISHNMQYRVIPLYFQRHVRIFARTGVFRKERPVVQVLDMATILETERIYIIVWDRFLSLKRISVILHLLSCHN